MTSSTMSRLSTAGTKPAPMPWMRCGPGGPPVRTADDAGSTATMRVAGSLAFSASPTPVIVPPVPTPATNTSTRSSSAREDLGAGAGPMGLGVGRVGELVGQEHVGVARHRAGGVDGLVHAAERLDHLHARAVEAQQRLALAAHALGQEDREVVALGGAAEGERDPGVARARLDDRRPARLDAPLGLGRLDHRDADAVLHRAAGIEGLELAVDLDVEILREEPREADHRRVADVRGDVDRNCPHCPSEGTPRRACYPHSDRGGRFCPAAR